MFEKVNKGVEVQYRESALPNMLITKKAINKMKIYIDECDKEISWLGTVENSDNIYLIKDVMLFEQEVSSVTTDIDETDLNNFAHNKIEELGDEGVDFLNSIKMWGHSHVNMSTFASGTDDESMEIFEDGGHDFYIRLIGNKKGSLKLDLFHYEKGIVYENLDFDVIVSEEERSYIQAIEAMQRDLEILREKEVAEMEEDIKAEIKLKVKKKSYIKSYTNTKAKTTSISSYKDSKYSAYDEYEDYAYYGLTSPYQNTMTVSSLPIAGMYLSEDEVWQIAMCTNTADVIEELKDMSLYFEQDEEELKEMLKDAQKALGFDKVRVSK